MVFLYSFFFFITLVGIVKTSSWSGLAYSMNNDIAVSHMKSPPPFRNRKLSIGPNKISLLKVIHCFSAFCFFFAKDFSMICFRDGICKYSITPSWNVHNSLKKKKPKLFTSPKPLSKEVIPSQNARTIGGIIIYDIGYCYLDSPRCWTLYLMLCIDYYT